MKKINSKNKLREIYNYKDSLQKKPSKKKDYEIESSSISFGLNSSSNTLKNINSNNSNKKDPKFDYNPEQPKNNKNKENSSNQHISIISSSSNLQISSNSIVFTKNINNAKKETEFVFSDFSPCEKNRLSNIHIPTLKQLNLNLNKNNFEYEKLSKRETHFNSNQCETEIVKKRRICIDKKTPIKYTRSQFKSNENKNKKNNIQKENIINNNIICKTSRINIDNNINTKNTLNINLNNLNLCGITEKKNLLNAFNQYSKDKQRVNSTSPNRYTTEVKLVIDKTEELLLNSDNNINNFSFAINYNNNSNKKTNNTTTKNTNKTVKKISLNTKLEKKVSKTNFNSYSKMISAEKKEHKLNVTSNNEIKANILKNLSLSNRTNNSIINNTDIYNNVLNIPQKLKKINIIKPTLNLNSKLVKHINKIMGTKSTSKTKKNKKEKKANINNIINNPSTATKTNSFKNESKTTKKEMRILNVPFSERSGNINKPKEIKLVNTTSSSKGSKTESEGNTKNKKIVKVELNEDKQFIQKKVMNNSVNKFKKAEKNIFDKNSRLKVINNFSNYRKKKQSKISENRTMNTTEMLIRHKAQIKFCKLNELPGDSDSEITAGELKY